jgi:hypothetical protein
LPILLLMTVKEEDLAVPTLPFEIEYLPTLSPGNLPAGALSVLIGCAAGVNLFRAPQEVPAGNFPAPEICHFSSRPRRWSLKREPF